ncbi:MAG: TonB family protein [Candidatus Schekmanbacteria bacterium]|nr:TonB family protein [Candidatus Schekmanbacteria bacterium]
MRKKWPALTTEKKGLIASILLHSVFLILLIYSSGFENRYYQPFKSISVNIINMAGVKERAAPGGPEKIAVQTGGMPESEKKAPPKANEEKNIKIKEVKKILPQKEEPKKSAVSLLAKKKKEDLKKSESVKQKSQEKKESAAEQVARTEDDMDRIMSKIDKVSQQVEKGRAAGNAGGGGTGMSGGDVTLDDIRYKLYYDRIWSKIKESWILPDIPGMDVKSMSVVISVKISKNGEIIEKSFEKKSGSTLFDESAMRAILKANPLPPLPEGFKVDTLDIGVRFTPE